MSSKAPKAGVFVDRVSQSPAATEEAGSEVRETDGVGWGLGQSRGATGQVSGMQRRKLSAFALESYLDQAQHLIFVTRSS